MNKNTHGLKKKSKHKNEKNLSNDLCKPVIESRNAKAEGRNNNVKEREKHGL